MFCPRSKKGHDKNFVVLFLNPLLFLFWIKKVSSESDSFLADYFCCCCSNQSTIRLQYCSDVHVCVCMGVCCNWYFIYVNAHICACLTQNLQTLITVLLYLLFQVYIVDLIRKPLPRYVKFVDPKKALEFECPISLSPLYRPITVKGSNPKHTYSAPFMDSVTRTSKVDLLSGQALPPDWRVVDRELEAKMSAEPAVIPLTYGGMLIHSHQSCTFWSQIIHPVYIYQNAK